MKRFSSLALTFVLFLFASCDKKRNEPKITPPASSDTATATAPEVVQETTKSPPTPPVGTVHSQSPENSPVSIQLLDDETIWEAQLSDVQVVLDNAAGQMMQFFPDRKVEPIHVFAKGGPITLYERDSGGRYTVKLQTGQTFWSQYSFQFAHELCHILSNYREDKNPNGWFEESLCEAASLFVLRSMGKSWETNPPFPNWQSYHQSLTNYAQKRIDETALQEHRPLAEWFAQWEPTLRESPSQRELNNVAAVKLLPLLEENPSAWESISWLNVEESFPEDTFREYLERWNHYVPDRHREFVKNVALKFGITFD